MTGIQREEDKVKKSLKDAAKKGDRDVCVVLAKELVRSTKAIKKIFSAKATLKTVEHSMSQQAGQCSVCNRNETRVCTPHGNS